jgi:hypothetical protein
MTVGIDAEKGKETLGHKPDVFVYEGHGSDAHQEHKDAFDAFKRSDCPESAPLAAVGV